MAFKAKRLLEGVRETDFSFGSATSYLWLDSPLGLHYSQPQNKDDE